MASWLTLHFLQLEGNRTWLREPSEEGEVHGSAGWDLRLQPREAADAGYLHLVRHLLLSDCMHEGHEHLNQHTRKYPTLLPEQCTVQVVNTNFCRLCLLAVIFAICAQCHNSLNTM